MTEHPLGLQESLDPMWDLNPFLFVCEIHNYNTHSSQEVRLVQPSASRNLSTTTSAAHRRSPSKVLCPLTALHSCSTMWSLWSFVYFGRGKTCLQQELQKQHFVQASLSFFTSRKKFQRYQSLDRRGLDRATTMISTIIHNQVIGPIEDSLHQSLG